jgi:hypothetical protein
MEQVGLYDDLRTFLASGEPIKASYCIFQLKNEFGEQNNPRLLKMEQECLRLFHYLIKDVIFSRQFDDAEELIRAYEMIANDSWIQDQKRALQESRLNVLTGISNQREGSVQEVSSGEQNKSVLNFVGLLIALIGIGGVLWLLRSCFL